MDWLFCSLLGHTNNLGLLASGVYRARGKGRGLFLLLGMGGERAMEEDKVFTIPLNERFGSFRSGAVVASVACSGGFAREFNVLSRVCCGCIDKL